MSRYKVETVFEHMGLNCVVIMTNMGHRCGYVAVPDTHVLYGKDYSEKSEHLSMNSLKEKEIDFDKVSPMNLLSLSLDSESEDVRIGDYFNVHGGITYSGGNEEYPIKSEKLWWFGYDCNHYNDAKDLSVVSEDIRKIEEMYPTGGILRTLDYCVDECKNLAEQLSEIK